MSGDQIEGGAGPAVAAHSKDASVAGSNPASAATGSEATSQGGASAVKSDPLTGISGQARDAARQAADAASTAFIQARQRLASANASDQVAEFIRDRPLAALLGAGVAGLLVGMLLSRR